MTPAPTIDSDGDADGGRDRMGDGALYGWLRPVGGAVGMGLIWAAGWAIAGVTIGIATESLPGGHPLRSTADPYVALATPGFLGGVLFSAVLRIAEGRRRLVELSLPRAGAWGAVTGLILGVIPFTLGTPTDAYPLWGLAVVIVGSTTLLCTASACGSRTLARRIPLAARNH